MRIFTYTYNILVGSSNATTTDFSRVYIPTDSVQVHRECDKFPFINWAQVSDKVGPY